MLKSFTGFKGIAALCECDGIQFLIVASHPKQLAALYATLLPNAAPFDPDRCQKSIIIEAATLPAKPAPRAPSISPITPIEV